jgi:hypothetical protein
LDGSQKSDDDIPGSIASLKPSLTDVRLEVLNPEPLPITADPDAGTPSSTVADPGDPALHALMFGRYQGQISARIERAWIRPRTPVDESRNRARASDNDEHDSPFICQVQIRQDPHGNVEEVLLLHCNGTEAWRHSLVVAINQSSPLPAPPIPAVFARHLTMTFEAQAYEPGAPEDEYEREGSGMAFASSAPAERSSVQTLDAASGQAVNSPRGNQKSSHE